MRVPLILCHNIIFYLYKIVCPVNLSSHYPFPDPFGPTHPMVLAGILGSFLLIIVLLISWRWTPVCLIGWLIFFVGVFPTMGGVGFTNVIASDKYTYLPSIGILMIIASFLGSFWSNNSIASRAKQPIFWAVVLSLTVFEARATRRYLTVWQDSESLYTHMLSLAPRAGVLYNNLGNILAGQGRTSEAITHFQRALELRPNYIDAYINLGLALAAHGETDEAIEKYKLALRLNPDNPKTHNNLGLALATQGKKEAAIVHYRRALKLKPDLAKLTPAWGSCSLISVELKKLYFTIERQLNFNQDL